MVVIMLNDFLEVHSHHWPISGESEDINALRLQRQHDGNPRLLSCAETRMQWIEPKSLINNQTGRVDHGAIYQIG
jgi:hypothetical protein